MSVPDLINRLFEGLSGCLTWVSAYRVWKDKGYAGVYLPAIVFFTSWGFWNLFYYPHLHQWLSFTGGLNIVTANTVWISLMGFYGRKA